MLYSLIGLKDWEESRPVDRFLSRPDSRPVFI